MDCTLNSHPRPPVDPLENEQPHVIKLCLDGYKKGGWGPRLI